METDNCVQCGIPLKDYDTDNICWECFLDNGYRSPQDIPNRTIAIRKETKQIDNDKPKAIKKEDA